MMPSDNELLNIDRMLQYVDKNEERMLALAKENAELRRAITALDGRVGQLMIQMQQTMLIGRGNGPTVQEG
jgi:hypothetical protein